ncbi:Tcp11-domain-containing protein, partial [Caulochytrium protostelioides]
SRVRTTDAASSSSSTASTPSPKASPPPKLAATLPAPPAAAAAAFNNAQLAHEVVLDPDFSLRNARTDADSFEAKVTEIAKRAFFDRVRSELAEGKHAMVPDLLMTMRENLLGMLPNATGATAVEIADKFDRDLMMQQLAEGTKRLDIPAYLHFVAAKMLSMCAPIRDRDIRAMEQVDDLALVMQRLLAIQEEMKLDIADYHLQQAKPLLKEHAVEYERSKFDAGVADGSITLSGTRAWLQASWDKAKAIADERNPESVNLEVNKPRFEDVYHDAVLELIFGNVPL